MNFSRYDSRLYSTDSLIRPSWIHGPYWGFEGYRYQKPGAVLVKKDKFETLKESIYDNSIYSSSYNDDNSLISDQPKRRFKPYKANDRAKQDRGNRNNSNKAAPISDPQPEKHGKSRGAFACGLPGGCGHGDCVKSPRGVTCMCHVSWTKNQMGRCITRK